MLFVLGMWVGLVISCPLPYLACGTCLRGLLQSYRFSCRQKNLGWRIDYALVSKDLASSVVDAFIRPDLLGSDHVPIGVVVDSSAV